MGINDNYLNGLRFDKEYIELIEEHIKKENIVNTELKIVEPIKKSSKEKIKNELKTETIKKRNVKTINVNTSDNNIVEL